MIFSCPVNGLYPPAVELLISINGAVDCKSVAKHRPLLTADFGDGG